MRSAIRTQPTIACWAKTCLLIVMAILSCQSDEPIRIGYLAGTSGRVADSSISGLDAVQLAVDECNLTGGVSGRRVQLIVKDDQGEPSVGRQAIRELVNEGVAAIIGPMTSDMALAVTPIANNGKILLVSPTATTEALSGKQDYFFRVASTTYTYATKSAEYLIKSGCMHRVVAVYDLDNRSFSENWIENFKKQFTELGGELIAAVGFSANGVRTFMGVVKEVLAIRPDGIVIVANSMDSAMICQQIRKLDTQVQIALSDWGATERLLELGGKSLEGIAVVQAFDRQSQHPRYQSFRKAYLERYYREPGFPGVNTYDAAQVILKALRSRKDGQTLQDAILANNRFEGLQGDFSFDAFGDALRPQASMSIVRDQQFITLE